MVYGCKVTKITRQIKKKAGNFSKVHPKISKKTKKEEVGL